MDRPAITYEEFKAVENNVRECFDTLRRLTETAKVQAENTARLLAVSADLSRRVAAMEEREALAAGVALKNRSGRDTLSPAFVPPRSVE